MSEDIETVIGLEKESPMRSDKGYVFKVDDQTKRAHRYKVDSGVYPDGKYDHKGQLWLYRVDHIRGVLVLRYCNELPLPLFLHHFMLNY